ncbi:UDP-N-acetylglucosamine 2-epimerase (hydrolyzing), partial [Clostridium perfringens]|nr:UDP-N-acetylglucosamine 2-epimerase (hydrolyzing) [Clostridium perfringens]
MSIKKILSFTGIRSDYDLMSGLYNKLNNSDDFEIGVIVSGAHLSDSYGYTVDNIEKDGIPIIAKIETLIDSSSKSARVKSLSILLQDCIHSVTMYNPDLIIYAGDREDVIVAGIIGSYLRIPTVHFFGGDHASDGNVDNSIRHATSKLSSLHFVSNNKAKSRLIKMGETHNRIFNVGSPALDKFISTRHISKEHLLKDLERSKWSEYAVVIFHPNTGEEEAAGKHFEEILLALEEKGIN